MTDNFGEKQLKLTDEMVFVIRDVRTSILLLKILHTSQSVDEGVVQRSERQDVGLWVRE